MFIDPAVISSSARADGVVHREKYVARRTDGGNGGEDDVVLEVVCTEYASVPSPAKISPKTAAAQSKT
jgi:hypothetical protein